MSTALATLVGGAILATQVKSFWSMHNEALPPFLPNLVSSNIIVVNYPRIAVLLSQLLPHHVVFGRRQLLCDLCIMKLVYFVKFLSFLFDVSENHFGMWPISDLPRQLFCGPGFYLSQDLYHQVKMTPFVRSQVCQSYLDRLIMPPLTKMASVEVQSGLQ